MLEILVYEKSAKKNECTFQQLIIQSYNGARHDIAEILIKLTLDTNQYAII
jgi:hypothetical protein